MRVGTNPMKHSATLPPYKRHRIVMAVYIPSRDGYFASALEIFRMSLASLLATVDPEHVSITVIDNASIPEVGEALARALADGRIDRVVHNAVNRGKPDAIVGEIRASYEQFVTLVDSDVMFLPGWLARVEEVFETWPEAGAVSPAGQSKTAFRQSCSTWMFGLLRGAIRLGPYVPKHDLLQFASSVGNPDLYADYETSRQFVLRRGSSAAVIGAGHFAITLRRSCYEVFSYRPRLEGTGHGMRVIDEQIDRSGRLRLSTTRAFVLHLGNTREQWMDERLAEVLAAPVHPLSNRGSRLDLDAEMNPRLPLWMVRPLVLPVMLFARVAHRGWRRRTHAR